MIKNLFIQSFSKKQAIWLWGVSIAILTLYNLTPRINGFDTQYYLLAGDNFWNGIIDCLRTPIYPLLLKSFNTSFENTGGYIGIVIIQSIVYLASVASIRNVTRIVIQNHIVRNAACFMYIVCVAPGWCNELMTESFSISGCIIITDWLCRYIIKPSWKLSIGIFILTILLIFLRPSFIFLLVILPCVWIVLWIKKSNRCIQVTSLILTIFVSILYLGYCKSYEKEYGVFTSSLSFANNIYDLKRSNSWNLEKISNPQAKNILGQIDEQWCGNYAPLYTTVSSDHKSLKYIALGCNEMKQGSKTALLQHRIEVTVASFDKRFNASVNTHTPLSAILFASALFFALPLSLFYSIVVFSCLALIIYVIKKRSIPLIAFILILFTTAQCIGILLYASEAHERLLLPVYPLFLILLFKAFEKGFQLTKQYDNLK